MTLAVLVALLWKDITLAKVKALSDAADVCWSAILAHDLQAFTSAYKASFNAQIAMFPAMVNPVAYGKPCPEASVESYIQKYSAMPGVLAWKNVGNWRRRLSGFGYGRR